MHCVFFVSQKLGARDGSPDAAALLLAFFSPVAGQAARDRASEVSQAAERGTWSPSKGSGVWR